MGKANLAKAAGFHQQQNWVQTLRYGELAATKLKQLKDRRLETVVDIDRALGCKYNALICMGRHREALECAEETYTLWAMNHLRNPRSMDAALHLIQSCIHNRKYEDAERYARHAMFMIAEMTDKFIPVAEQPKFLADISYYLAQAILANAGGIPPEGKQKAGVEAIALARQALEMHTQLDGTENVQVAADVSSLADVLDHFNDVDDDEILRLHEQAIAIFGRLEGSLSVNVAVDEDKLSAAHRNRARRAQAANDLDRCLTNLELALSHHREAARIYRAINRMNDADDALRKVARTEEDMRRIGIKKAAAAAAAAVAATRG